ncbi:putative Bivalent Mical/EHBP Rab binding domain-containing protein [Homarus americanus]|uniref:Putative Bivalent Mical/EHBP Rab binding domain-containing protein n=1 Tax=Homarus americanus TaxID=6706 RepID=A0A8J5JTB8_HOMAM|nr:putative Bivalent Mical/EHBP Rab binding domain-containing protein [Homarus americanus]
MHRPSSRHEELKERQAFIRTGQTRSSKSPGTSAIVIKEDDDDDVHVEYQIQAVSPANEQTCESSRYLQNELESLEREQQQIDEQAAKLEKRLRKIMDLRGKLMGLCEPLCLPPPPPPAFIRSPHLYTPCPFTCIEFV